MKISPLLIIDGYKTSHPFEYTKGTNLIQSNWTPRASRTPFNEVVFFGLQYYIKEYLQKSWQENFFDLPKRKVVAAFNRRMNGYLGPNVITTNHIEALHDLQYLPLKIKALDEGTLVPLRVPMLTVENTHPDFFWLTNFIETNLSNVLWMPCTSATTAYNYRKVFNKYADETGSDKSFCQWQGHDFAYRGLPGLEAACLSDAGHLLSFTGTDTIPAIDFFEQYYEADCETELIGGSVPASEHSVSSLGILNNLEKYNGNMEDAEYDLLHHLLTVVHPSGVFSYVSDTFDYWTLVTKILPRLKSVIMSRNGKLVIRPDSGDPVKIVVGDDNHIIGSNEFKGSIQCLWDIFGGTVTPEGYKVLDSHIGLIYGDSITLDRQEQILGGLKNKGFASSNVVLGIGSYTYQYVTRDTYGFAMKATYGEVNGKPIIMYKDPKTDNGVKKSARGKVGVFRNSNGVIELRDNLSEHDVDSTNNLLKTVFENGRLKWTTSLKEIRNKLWPSL
jgi:nicotinamide phosphoribosyltransferase